MKRVWPIPVVLALLLAACGSARQAASSSTTGDYTPVHHHSRYTARQVEQAFRDAGLHVSQVASVPPVGVSILVYGNYGRKTDVLGAAVQTNGVPTYFARHAKLRYTEHRNVLFFFTPNERSNAMSVLSSLR